jgi:uncharacterized protein YndB with AHSA1/START domain
MKKTPAAQDNELLITRLIDAPVARVWRAWSDSSEIVKWWGPHGFSDESTSREFKEGGIWKHVMIGPDGARYLNTAKYVEIVPEKKIVVKNGGGKEFDEKGVGFVSTITFEAQGDKTLITMRSAFMEPGMKKRAVEEFGAVQGGQQTLSRLNAHVTGQFMIARLVSAPRARVWRAWTTEKELAIWMGPKGSEGGYAKLDFRVGGSFHYSNKFAGTEMWGLVHYTEIVEPEKIVYVMQFSDKDRGLTRHPMAPTWPKRLLTTIHFQDFGEKTLVTLYWDPIEPGEDERATFTAALDGMKGGWGGSFDRLDEFLAGKE